MKRGIFAFLIILMVAVAHRVKVQHINQGWDFIVECKEQGVADDKIKQALVAHNWPESVVSYFLKVIK